MENKKTLIYLSRILVILIFIGLSFFLFFSSPEKLVGSIGVQNAYGLIFILAFLGGLTTFTGVPYHPVLVVLAVGGLNPFLLGLSTAFGVMLGDSTSYFVGYQGGAIVPQGIQRFLRRLLFFAMRYPRTLPLFFFLYGSLCPFSNDFIVISMGLAHYPFWRVMIPLGMGNLVFNISLAYLATYAYQLLQGIIF